MVFTPTETSFKAYLPGWRWARIKQLALVGSSSSLHSEACKALGGSDGVVHSKISGRGIAASARVPTFCVIPGSSGHVAGVGMERSATSACFVRWLPGRPQKVARNLQSRKVFVGPRSGCRGRVPNTCQLVGQPGRDEAGNFRRSRRFRDVARRLGLREDWTGRLD